MARSSDAGAGERVSDVAAHRGLAVRLAYDITGSWADAEEIAQDAMLRVLQADAVRDERALLARVTTNLAIDRVRRSRVDYVGPWLPEPIATGPGADAAVADAEEVELALMVALESLSPIERAALLLHDVFDFSFDEVAEMLGRSTAAVRQAASRARAHAQARRPRFAHTDADARALVERFAAAALRGDVDGLVAMLAEDATLVSDGGGKVSAARRPVVGAERVARFLAGLSEQFAGRVDVVPLVLNRATALGVLVDGELDHVHWAGIEGGRITELRIVRNPDKLAQARAAFARSA
ncbi:sigma-70 family RNA polymerase sigma factor [Agrococcus sp. HG114]|uniref:sigma-70 family RNA polymerase sigma factor n=1 Tax=Agrococcus sp. HG114 TaxID=2969757 RepID=UPI00215B5C9F|nr:sigma-70 family RNA polymerase sigma factor [Agrococcus sp. HG114]